MVETSIRFSFTSNNLKGTLKAIAIETCKKNKVRKLTGAYQNVNNMKGT